MKRRFPSAIALLAAIVLAATLENPETARGADGYVPFDGEKSAWHEGFDRYDYVMSKLGALAANDVPLLHVCGSIDPLLGKVSAVIEGIYQQLGGRISVMIKDGAGHHPHSLRDPKPIADFITQSVQSAANVPPDFLSGKVTRNSFYSIANDYRDFPGEGTNITCRGPFFTGAYDRFSFELPGVEGAITVIVPKEPAPGKPWVFRAGFVDRTATVDLTLLAKGFHVVTGPIPYNRDAPVLEHWNAVYDHLTEHGFSKMPVLEGAGRAPGEVLGRAVENPGKVSFIYGENPVLRSFMTKSPLLESLAPLARAGVPMLSVCGSLDPALKENTRVLEKRYLDLGGSITVLIKEGEGHARKGAQRLAPLCVEVGPRHRSEWPSANARQPRAVTGNPRWSTLVLGQHEKRCLPEWVQHGGDDRGAVGNKELERLGVQIRWRGELSFRRRARPVSAPRASWSHPLFGRPGNFSRFDREAATGGRRRPASWRFGCGWASH